MALLTATQITRAGVRVDDATAADVAGDRFVNTEREVLYVHNGSGASINVTLDIQATVDGAAVSDPVVAIPAGQSKLIGPFPRRHYNDAEEEMNVSYSAVTTVTRKVFKF